MAIAMPDG